MTVKGKNYDDICAGIAESAQHIMLKDLFARDFCVRYNKTKGAYFSRDDLNNDIIIMRSGDFRRDFDFFAQCKHVKEFLKNKPIYPV